MYIYIWTCKVEIQPELSAKSFKDYLGGKLHQWSNCHGTHHELRRSEFIPMDKICHDPSLKRTPLTAVASRKPYISRSDAAAGYQAPNVLGQQVEPRGHGTWQRFSVTWWMWKSILVYRVWFMAEFFKSGLNIFSRCAVRFWVSCERCSG